MVLPAVPFEIRVRLPLPVFNARPVKPISPVNVMLAESSLANTTTIQRLIPDVCEQVAALERWVEQSGVTAGPLGCQRQESFPGDRLTVGV